MQTESEQLFEESKKYIPGGVNSPVRAFGSVGRSPIFIKKAKGSRIFDEDGREYIDYVCSWGPGILGHAKETVIEAVKAACDDGLTFGAPTRKELEIAELITAHMPSMEMSRMVNSGTEAVMSAIRAARGFFSILTRSSGLVVCTDTFIGLMCIFIMRSISCSEILVRVI